MLKLFINNSLAVLYVVLISPVVLTATHIVGGDFTYRCLGNDLYEISLTLRRDCINGQPNFDNPANIGIFDSHGILQTSLGQSGRLRMPYRRDDTLNEFLEESCGIIGGDVCVHTTTYRETLRLPFLSGGYTLAYQRCCRNYTIRNILYPLWTGATYTLEITEDALRLCNSSPKLGPYPPIYICGDHSIAFDLKAYDADGDSLVYFMCDPNTGADTINPQPSFPSAPPYQKVEFKPPYTISDMIGGIPPLQINQNTGLMTGFAVNVIAQYLVAYCVEEYRNGILLSRLRRDFQINVRYCNSVPIARFNYSLNRCQFPYKITVQDQSKDLYSTIDSWNWELTLNSVQQNSNMQNPVFTVADTGIATLKLVIHSKESCPDTFVQEIRIQPIQPEFDSLSHTICKGDSIELVKSFDPNGSYSWSPAAGLSCVHCANPKASPDKDIKYVVKSTDGICSRTDTITVAVINCIVDSCAMSIRKTCLQNGMVEIAALDFKGKVIEPKPRVHELFLDVKQNGIDPAFSLSNKNPVLLTSNRAFTLTSKIYRWKPNLPKTIEYAEICKRVLSDSSNIECSGPCEDIQFILSSCEDDYDVANNLNFPPSICQSICSNACNYIVGLFETDGTLINPSNYKIKWSVGGSGAYVMMMGPYYNTLTVEVQKGDCNWYGRYWKSCKNYQGNLHSDLPGLNSLNPGVIDLNRIEALIQSTQAIWIYNIQGQLISVNKYQIENLESGIYFLQTGDDRGSVYKLIK